MTKQHHLARRVPSLLAAVLLSAASAAYAQDPAAARDAFFDRLAALCGTSFSGYMSFPDDPEHAFAGKLLVATIADCDENEVRVPFAVGEDRSRTWIVSRRDGGLSLKHDHRHGDGTPDEITMYGGWAAGPGDASSQSFAADEHTATLIPEAATNVWTLRLSDDGTMLTYELTRHARPRFSATLNRR